MNAAAILARAHAEAPPVGVVGDCLIWDGAVQSSGYGSVDTGLSTALVHRVVFEEQVRPLGWGETIDHRCRRILCVNVDHLEPVSRAENSRRRHAAQTECKHGHPLSGVNVRLVTRSNGYTYRVCIACRRRVNAEHMRRARASKAVA